MIPDYSDIHPEIHVRISELPVKEMIRDVRQIHLNALVKVCAEAHCSSMTRLIMHMCAPKHGR